MNYLLAFFTVLSLWISGNEPGEPDYRNKVLLRELENQGFSTTPEALSVSMQTTETGEMPGSFFKIHETGETNHTGYLYVGRVNTCRSGGCSSSGTSLSPDHEYFDYFMVFDELGQVRGVKIFNYQATKGHEITSKGWLKQFQGYTGGMLSVGKEVDGITGATISVFAITGDIRLRTTMLREYLSYVAGQMHPVVR